LPNLTRFSADSESAARRFRPCPALPYPFSLSFVPVEFVSVEVWSVGILQAVHDEYRLRAVVDAVEYVSQFALEFGDLDRGG
jgi:hypothetical protein